METIFFQVLGAFAFFINTLFIGLLIRRSPTKTNAERLSRVSHTLFWSGLVLPELIGVFHPGLIAFDGLLGLPSLPYPLAMQITGWPILLAGTYYLAMSNVALKVKGSGFASFKLTRRVVVQSVYERARNPMSLGFYLAYIGISLIAGSSYFLLGVLAVIIPVHAFNLLYFEKRELLARYGSSYAEYMNRVPFILPIALSEDVLTYTSNNTQRGEENVNL
ncbi:isoprenylcysteine carboxylmethyltransferase family protein [bacterium]|nr:isoprenylcysteine carboxylmethyltransferase family protein [bacterium]